VPLLFTSTYLAAVPLFLLATMEIPLWVLPVDALLRAQGATRFLLWFSAVRIVVAAVLVLGGIHFFGLAGAIGGSIATEAFSRVCMITRGCRHLGVRVRAVFDAGMLVRIAISAAIASAAAWPVRLVLHRLPLLVVSMAVYGAAYVLCRAVLRPRTPAPASAGVSSGRAASAAAA
jgi:O-antigen/teichoic acid export membrane protein